MDRIAEEFIRDNGGIPAFKGYNGFPNPYVYLQMNKLFMEYLMIKFFDGDILSVDCGVLMNNYYGDSAYTYEVGEINKEKKIC